jgi:hypothetical protein
MPVEPFPPVGIDAFLEMPTPRRLPKAVRKVALGNAASPVSIGLLVLLIGLFVTWIFFPFHLSRHWILDILPTRTVSGTVLSVKQTNMESNGSTVMEHRFGYELENKEHKQGIAYTSGGNWQVGTPLRVRHLVSDPDLALPEGARLGPNSMICVVVVILPLAGLVLFSVAVFRWYGDLKILRMGTSSMGTITSVKRTSAEAGDKTCYEIHLTSRDNGEKLVRRSQHVREISFAMARQDSGEPVRILHVPYRMKRFLLPELWHG